MSKIYAVYDQQEIVWGHSDFLKKLSGVKFFLTREGARQHLITFTNRLKEAQAEDPKYCCLVEETPDRLVWNWGWEDMNRLEENPGTGWVCEIVELDCEEIHC